LAVLALPLFVAGQSYASVIPVDLGTAGNFAILTQSGISNTGTTSIVGDIGVSPIAATGITGNFALAMDASGTFSKSSLVTGKVYASDYTPPTPANLGAAISAMEAAYTNAQGRTPSVTELGGGTIANQNLIAGVYSWTTPVTITTDLTLTGSATDVWIFQVTQTLDISSAMKVILSGGALPGNVFWQVAGQTTLGTTSVFQGTILDHTAIVMETGATLDGRALAQTATTLDSNVVVAPAVPEPVTMTLILIGGALLGLRRRTTVGKTG
jgi:hypothetical protein